MSIILKFILKIDIYRFSSRVINDTYCSFFSFWTNGVRVLGSQRARHSRDTQVIEQTRTEGGSSATELNITCGSVRQTCAMVGVMFRPLAVKARP